MPGLADFVAYSTDYLLLFPVFSELNDIHEIRNPYRLWFIAKFNCGLTPDAVVS